VTGKPLSGPADQQHPDLISAAGTLLWRDAPGGVEVALIHRPGRDDWTIPKGKVEPGEHVLAAAVRETTEETGIRPVLGRPLATAHYRVESGPKRVDYWAAQVTGPLPAFTPNHEVDRLDWLPAAAAATRLTYRQDVALLDRLLDHAGAATVPYVLLRHASAGRRGSWPGADLLRPLDDTGLADARTVAGLLACYAPERVISSAAERCLATVRPYAEQAGRDIVAEPLFTARGPDDADRGAAARQRFAGLLADAVPTVVCAHRENLPLLLATARDTLRQEAPPLETPAPVDDAAPRRISPPRSTVAGDWALPKPGFWVLHVADGRLLAVEHHDLSG